MLIHFLLGMFCIAANIPMGIWRSRVKKFSPAWFIAIHAPVPLVIAIRVLSGISLWFIPLFILLSVLGQLIGGKIGTRQSFSKKIQSAP